MFQFHSAKSFFTGSGTAGSINVVGTKLIALVACQTPVNVTALSVGGESASLDYSATPSSWSGKVYAWRIDNPTTGSSKSISITHDGFNVALTVFDVSGIALGSGALLNTSDNYLASTTYLPISVTTPSNGTSFSIENNSAYQIPTISGSQSEGERVYQAGSGYYDQNGSHAWSVASTQTMWLFAASYKYASSIVNGMMMIGF